MRSGHHFPWRESRRPWRRLALPAAIVGGVIVAVGLCSSSAELQAEGGAWYTGFAGSTHTGLGKVDLFRATGRGRHARVDQDVFVRGFYPPDCILYEPGREPGVIFAACGERQPVPVAYHTPWGLSGGYEVNADGLRRVRALRVVDGRAMAEVAHVPLADIRRVAEAAPMRTLAWSVVADPLELAVEPIVTEIPADPQAQDGDGWTPLLASVRDSQPDVVAALLEAGADPNAQGGSGTTPLLVAIGAVWPDTALVRLLLTAGADTEIGDRLGTTPLLIAALGKKPEVFTMLLAHGADPCVRDWQNKSIVEFAGDHERLRPLAVAAWRRCAP